ncbi:MAG TPA: ribonuclease P protein component [Candidatus Paceibacterota bacterium]
MLPNQKRLTTTLFKDTIDGGMTYHSSLFILKLLKTIGPSRFSVSVPKKVAKSAVERNKIRRRVYSAIRILYPKIKEGFYGVFISKDSIKKASFIEISSILEQSFVKLGLLK